MAKEKSTLQLGLILLLITAIAGLFLGFAYEQTKEPIAIAQDKANKAALAKVLPEAEDFTKLEDVSLPEGSIVREIYKSTNEAGYAFKVYPNGYGGPVEIVVGINSNNTISGIEILKHAETPGLGAKANDPSFKGQYVDKSTENNIDLVKGATSEDNQISAISGATITSRAVTTGVNAVLDLYRDEFMSKEGK